MRRLEKYVMFSEVVAGITLRFQEQIFPTLRRYGSNFENGRLLSQDVGEELFVVNEEYDLRGLYYVCAESLSSGLESAHKVVVSALALLSFVYHYLIGCVDKGGGISHPPGSFLFGLIFVAVALFLGSYVWIKFRQTSYTASRRKRKSGDVPGSVYRRAVKDARGLVRHYRYEPRFKPLREKLESGTSVEINRLSLGSYDTPREAENVLLIAAVLYGEVKDRPVQFEDGLCLQLPSVTEAEKCPPCGKEKADWVTCKTKELYAQLLEEARRLQPLPSVIETDSHDGHDGETRRGDPSPSAPDAPSTGVELANLTLPHGGHGVAMEWATSEFHSVGQEPLLAGEVVSTFFPDCDFEHDYSSLPPWEENDFPPMGDLDRAEGSFSETLSVSGFDSTSVPPQPSALGIPNSTFSASLPELGVGDQGWAVTEPYLYSTTAITFQQLESLPERVQREVRVACQEQCPGELSGSVVDLQQRLPESEVQFSELQQRLHQSEVEKEKWRSMFRELARLI